MYSTSLISRLVLIAFIFVAMFGLSIMAASSHTHDVGCTSFIPMVCEEVLAHVGHWQSVLLALVVEVLVLGALVFILFSLRAGLSGGKAAYARYRLRERVPQRPTLLQELFSQGILNRKEPLFVC